MDNTPSTYIPSEPESIFALHTSFRDVTSVEVRPTTTGSLIPEYEFTWHKLDKPALLTCIDIFVYGTEAQIVIKTGVQQGYLHLRSDSSGYLFTLCCTCIALAAVTNRDNHPVDIGICTNLSVSRIKWALSDTGDNHRTSVHATFAYERHLRWIVVSHRLTISVDNIALAPKRMSVSTPLITNAPDQISLISNGQPIHSYRMHLVELPCTREYQTYLQDKYGFEQHWEDIDWLPFCNAMTSYGSNGPTMWKLLHGWLSTANASGHHGKHKTRQCPFCDQEETTAHLFTCRHQDRCMEISHQLGTYYELISQLIHPEIVNAIKEQISNWRLETEYTIDPRFAKALTVQSEIGWSQFLRGRWAKQFRVAQMKIMAHCNHRNPARAAMKTIIQALHITWDLCRSIWETRNKRAHSVLESTKTIRYQEAEKQVKAAFAACWCIPFEMRKSLFPCEANEILTKPPDWIERWLDQIQRIIKCQQDPRVTQSDRRITDYFIQSAHLPGRT